MTLLQEVASLQTIVCLCHLIWQYYAAFPAVLYCDVTVILSVPMMMSQ